MAIIDIDIIKYDPESEDDNAIAWKFPREDISQAAQLTVGENQEAIFFKDGKVFGTFGPGKHELETDNVPWLRGLVKFSLGGKTPYAAEVWYVNTTVTKELKWGTKNRLPVKVPLDNGDITVNVGAFGSWKMRVTEPRIFITEIVGAQTSSGHIGPERVKAHFGTEIRKELNRVLAKFFVERKIPITEFNDHNAVLAESIKRGISPKFQKYGIEIESFLIESINIPEKDSNMLGEIEREVEKANRQYERKERDKLQEIDLKKREQESEIETINNSRADYAIMREYDAREKAAETPGDSMEQLLGAGLGLGTGIGAGVSLAEKISRATESDPQNDPSEMDTQSKTNNPTESDPQNDPIAKLQKLKELLAMELITEEEFNEKKKQILDAM